MKKSLLFVLIFFSFLPLEAELYSETILPGTRNFLSIRVEFQEDNTYLTTGNGKFMLSEWTGHDTMTYAVDALPHNRAYFASHLKFIDNYWNRASNGNVRINTADDHQLPLADSSFTLSKNMLYYSNPDSVDHRLANLIYESVKLASDAGEYKDDIDAIIIYHAGAGQDFKITLDDSPFDIPSFYFDENYLANHLPTNKYNELMNLNCKQGIVLPESQNQLGYNIALNGTEILLTGMLLGLPTLYDTELGRSGTGIYGLMDQGSNTASGLCPIKPSAFERYLLGAAQPVTVTKSDSLTLKRDEVYHLPISSNEYFLIEYRKNSGAYADSIMWSRNDVNNYLDVLRILDSLDLVDYSIENGVLLDYSDLDVGLPTHGLLIWHVNEAELGGKNPNDWDSPFINLIEADGGNDIGKFYGSLNTAVNSGWKWDMWFKNNPAYFDNNKNSHIMQWNDASYPSTRSFENLASGIAINNFDFYLDSVVLDLKINSPADYHFSNIIFDEMTTALPADISADKLLLGYSDSSLVLLSDSTLKEIYASDAVLGRGNTALMTYNNDILLITNSDKNSHVKHLEYLASSLQEVNSMDLGHALDLEKLALAGDSLFLPPLSVEDSLARAIYKLDIASWTANKIGETSETLTPYLKNNKIGYAITQAAAVMNNDVITADEIGFSINGNSMSVRFESNDHYFMPDFYPVYGDNHYINEIIPLHMDDDGEYDLLVLSEFEGKQSLSAFSKKSLLLNNFPIMGNYSKIRVFKLADAYKILVYNPAGILDIYNIDGSKQASYPASVKANSLFVEQVSDDAAWIIADGTVIRIESNSVYWGYQGQNAAHSNTQSETQTAVIIDSDLLIKDGLVYNYPNPIQGDRTKFRFYATGAQEVRIDIYALSGMYIKTIMGRVFDQQWNEFTWFVHDEESGVYIAKITFNGDNKEETYFIKPAILK
ncbi:MAG: hypothetical protein WCT23_06665 [Candidatus Neomarinimicrobiota bacterium]